MHVHSSTTIGSSLTILYGCALGRMHGRGGGEPGKRRATVRRTVRYVKWRENCILYDIIQYGTVPTQYSSAQHGATSTWMWATETGPCAPCRSAQHARILSKGVPPMTWRSDAAALTDPHAPPSHLPASPRCSFCTSGRCDMGAFPLSLPPLPILPSHPIALHPIHRSPTRAPGLRQKLRPLPVLATAHHRPVHSCSKPRRAAPVAAFLPYPDLPRDLTRTHTPPPHYHRYPITITTSTTTTHCRRPRPPLLVLSLRYITPHYATLHSTITSRPACLVVAPSAPLRSRRPAAPLGHLCNLYSHTSLVSPFENTPYNHAASKLWLRIPPPALSVVPSPAAPSMPLQPKQLQ